jgi:hypothetical protein
VRDGHDRLGVARARGDLVAGEGEEAAVLDRLEVLGDRARGRRISQTISYATVSGCGCPSSRSKTACHTALGLSATDPIATPTVIVTTSSTAQPISTADRGRRSRRRAGLAAARAIAWSASSIGGPARIR